MKVDWSEILHIDEVLDAPPPGFKSTEEIAAEIDRSESHTHALLLKLSRAGEIEMVKVRTGRAAKNYWNYPTRTGDGKGGRAWKLNWL